MRFNRPLLFLLLVMATLPLLSTQALADDPIQVEQFEVMPDQHGNILNVATSRLVEHLGFSVGALFQYVDSPLRAVYSGGERDGEEIVIIENQIKTEVYGTFGLFDWFDIGVAVPFTISQSGNGSEELGIDAPEGFAMGDARIVPRARLLPVDLVPGLGLAFVLPIYLPTGDQDSFNGEGFRAEPRLAFDYHHEDLGFGLAINLGYLIRGEGEVHNIVNDDVFKWSLGAYAPTGLEGLELMGTVFGSVQTADSKDPTNLGAASDDLRSSPLEALGGIRYTHNVGLHTSVAAGRGLNTAVGSPELRVLASIGFTPLDDDADDDTIKDDVDQCPDQPEDFDTYKDDDGCPDPDNDMDEILDINDDCPLQAEDLDMFDDEDGCPDLDDDEDKILDEDDLCKLEAEDHDGYMDEDGCPDPDNDDDGILDGADSCPLVAEDMDGFEDEDGCLEADNDNDRFCDPWVDDLKAQQEYNCVSRDQCPLEAEVINGYEDEDGCPDKGEVKVIIKKDKIEILDKVYFATNKAKIKKKSYGILDQVVSVMKTNPQITKVRVEGHTDDRGGEKANLKLSERRAKAVMDYLIDKGVEPERLESQGFGESVPIDTNDTKDGRANNRRVEFTIVESGGAAVETR